MNNPFENTPTPVDSSSASSAKKSNKRIVIVVVIVIVVIAAIVAAIFLLRPDADTDTDAFSHHFRNVDLGMTLAEVRSAENNSGELILDSYIVENVEMYDMQVRLNYLMSSGTLDVIGIFPTLAEKENSSDEIHKNFLKGLEKQYGHDYEETEDALQWKFDGYTVHLFDDWVGINYD